MKYFIFQIWTGKFLFIINIKKQRAKPDFILQCNISISGLRTVTNLVNVKIW